MFSLVDRFWGHTLWNRTWIWLVLWVCIQLFSYTYYGAKVLVDTQRFVEEAAAWRAGAFEGSYHFWYSGYILFLCLFSDPVAQAQWIVLLQILVAFFAFIALLRLLDFRNSTLAKGLLFIYILYLPYHQWNVCLLTESLFCSGLIFSLYFWVYRERYLHRYALVGSLLAVCLLRPNGFLLPLALILYWAWIHRQKLPKLLWLLSTIATVLILFLVNNATDVFYLFIKNALATGDYICGYPSPYQIPLEVIHSVDEKYEGTLVKLCMLFASQPRTFLTLVFLKVAYLLAEVRPFYNSYHNVFSATTVALLYIGLFRNLRKLQGAQVLSMIFIMLNILTVAMTYCDWDGRFFAALFPYLLYMACPQKDIDTRPQIMEQHPN